MAVRRILIVDDSPDVRRMLGISLRMMSSEFDVLEVPSAEEALLVGSSLPLDLMVADVRLPGMSGLDMLTRLRKRSPALKVILVTGAMDTPTRREVAAAGADAFFYKPVEMGDFLDTVERLLGLKEASPQTPAEQAPAAQAPAAQAPAEQAPVLPAITLEPPVLTLAERLSTLRQELRAYATLLVDDSGHVVAQAGDLPLLHSDPALMPAIMATVSASLKISYGLGAETPDHMMFFSGAQHHLCLAPVGAGVLLIVSQAGFPSMQLGAMRQSIRQAAAELQQILSSIGVEVKPSQELPLPPELVELPLDPQAMAGLDALFSTRQRLQEQDVDAFWDTLSEQSELDGAGNADALTYEQARQLGLAPEETEGEA